MRRFAIATEQISSLATTMSTMSRSVENTKAKATNPFHLELKVKAENKVRDIKYKKSLKDYFEESKYFIRSDGGGQPRWFSPMECGCRLENSPLLLYLPGKCYG